MINCRVKGRKLELKAKAELKEQGWDVIITPMQSRFLKQVDFFGLFDLIAIKGPYIRFIQVKSNYKITKEWRAFLDDFMVRNWSSFFKFELWVREKKEWRIILYEKPR